jgi:WD40 repeat protein
MLRRLLRLFLYGLLGVFFLVFAVSAIYYARGYRYNFDAGRLEKTGLILLNSRPDGARVTVNGKDLGDKTPSRADALLPGRHEVTVERDGYRVWQKSLQVRAERVTFARYIVLIPKNLTTRRVATDQTIDSLRVSPDGSRLFYLTGGGTELWQMQTDGSERRRLFTAASADPTLVSGSEPVTLQLGAFSPDGNRLLVLKRQGSRPSYWSVSSGITTLDTMLPPEASGLQFDPRDSRRIYFLRAGVLFRLNTADGTISSPILTDVLSYRASGERIHAIRTVAGVWGFWQSDDAGSRLERIEAALAAGSYTMAYAPETDAVALFSESKGTIYLPSGGRHRAAQIIEGTYQGAEWNREGDRLVFWRGDNVGSWDLETRDRYTVSTQASVEAVAWTSDGDHLTISGADGLSSFVEFDGAYPLTFKSLKPGTLSYLPDRHELAYVDQAGKFFTIDLRRT